MKKLLYLSSITALCLFAETPNTDIPRETVDKTLETKEQAEALQPEDKTSTPISSPRVSPQDRAQQRAVNSRFGEALKLFNDKKYKEAFDQFTELFMQKMDDPRINFYLGRSALELKDYDQASAAFERVLIVNPDHARTRLELARLYMETQQFEQAEKEFQKVLENKKLPDNVKTNIEKLLVLIDKAKQRHYLSGTVILGTSYDTNVNTAIGEVDYIIPYYYDLLGAALSGERADDDVSITTLGMLNHIYDMGKKGGFMLQSSLMYYKQTYRNYTSGNIDLASLTITPTYNSKTYSLKTAFAVDKIWYGLNALSNSVSIKPSIDYIISKNYTCGLSTTYKRNFYYGDNFAKSADTYELSTNVKRIFTSLSSALGMTLTFSKDLEHYNDEAFISSRDDVSKSVRTYKLDYTSPIWKKKKISGSLAYTFKETSYTDTSSSYYTKEKEDQQVVGGKMFLPGTTLFDFLGKKSILNLNYDFTHQRSNFADSNYQKHLVGLNYIYSF